MSESRAMHALAKWTRGHLLLARQGWDGSARRRTPWTSLRPRWPPVRDGARRAPVRCVVSTCSV